MTEQSPSTPGGGAAASISAFDSGLGSFLTSLAEGVQQTFASTSQYVSDFSEGVRATTHPILSAVSDLSRTAEAFGYMGMAFDPSNRSGIAGVIDRSRQAAETTESISQRIDEGVDRIQESAQGLEDFDAASAGQRAYLEYKQGKRKRRKRKLAEQPPANTSVWSSRRRRRSSGRR